MFIYVCLVYLFAPFAKSLKTLSSLITQLKYSAAEDKVGNCSANGKGGGCGCEVGGTSNWGRVGRASSAQQLRSARALSHLS